MELTLNGAWQKGRKLIQNDFSGYTFHFHRSGYEQEDRMDVPDGTDTPILIIPTRARIYDFWDSSETVQPTITIISFDGAFHPLILFHFLFFCSL